MHVQTQFRKPDPNCYGYSMQYIVFVKYLNNHSEILKGKKINDICGVIRLYTFGQYIIRFCRNKNSLL